MAKAGRPRKYGRAALAVTIRVRALRSEEDLWKRTARVNVPRLSLSEWIRGTLNAEARRVAVSRISGEPDATRL